MKVDYFDSHTHLQFEVYKDKKEYILKTLENKVGFVNVGTNKFTSLKAVELLKDFFNEPIYATVGLHPIHVKKNFFDQWELKEEEYNLMKEEEFDFDFYQKLALTEKVVAIGECGLDYFHLKEEEDKLIQKEIFLKQLNLAYKIKKPLMIHCRNAYDDLIEILKSNLNYLNNPPGIIHFFSGKKQQAKILLDLGFYFTFGGVITLTNSYYDVIKYLPLDRILTETDAPYVTPLKYKGQINQPLYVIEVVLKIQEIKKIDIEELKRQLILNNEKVFKINLS